MITLLATIVVLGVLIFVHELGHFATAKWAGIAVPRFSIGLGPKLWGFKRGETEYVISWLPLGGYVRMAGMEDMEALEGEAVDVEAAKLVGRDFESKSIPVRALVLAAGVIMNVLFAWFLFSVIAMIWGVRESPPPIVGDVVEERVPQGASALLDLPRGARVVAVGDEAVSSWLEVQRAMSRARDSVSLVLEGGPVLTMPVPEADSARAALILSIEPEWPIAPAIGDVLAGSPAASAGMQAGDRVVSAGGRPVATWQDFVQLVEQRPGEPVDLVVVRDDRQVPLVITPEVREVAAAPGRTVGRIGVTAAQNAAAANPRERLGPIAAFVHGGEQTWTVTAMILGYLGGLFTGNESPRDVGGPILIYQISEQVVAVGLDAFLDFMALFSINLAILNLLPIPILDGGQLLFLAIEAIRGRALSIEQRMRWSQVGLVVVVAIMVWALANDVLRLFGL